MKLIVLMYEESNQMNERSLVNKVIALLSVGQTKVVANFRFDVSTILFDSNLNLKCLYLLL